MAVFPMRWRGCSLGVALLFAAPAAPAEELKVSELVELLSAKAKERSDGEAISLISQLTQRFQSTESEAEQKVIAKGVEKCLARRRKEGDDQLYIATVQSFASMGDVGAGLTVKSLKNSNVKKRPKVLSAAVESLGTHADPKRVRVIQDFLTHRDSKVVASAARALANYSTAEQRLRKTIVSKMVQVFNMAASNARTPGNGERYATIRGPFNQALRKLTGAKEGGAEAWQRWNNKNKNKKWK